MPDTGTLIFRGMTGRKKKISQGRLYPVALKLAKAMPLDLLIRKTGLPESWLRKFRQEEIKAPSVQRIEIVLTACGKRLEIWAA